MNRMALSSLLMAAVSVISKQMRRGSTPLFFSSSTTKIEEALLADATGPKG